MICIKAIYRKEIIVGIKTRLCLLAIGCSLAIPFALANPTDDYSARPQFLGKTITKNYYDGQSDDLLTAGWSYAALSQRKMDKTFDKMDAASRRKIAYFNNIIALIDTTEAGGYGRLTTIKRNPIPIAGFEYLSYALNEQNQLDTTLMLQIPDNFDLKKSCIIVAATSGSRGIYGAVGTVGSWALINGCAIAYTDKGTGSGFYFFDEQKGYSITGEYSRASEKNVLTYFNETDLQQSRLLKHFPTAIATKQAHSQDNVERKFGEYVVQATKFALFQLNAHFAENKHRFTPENSLIIAASISNGGAASLRAVEFDTNGLFDGVVAAEPNIYPPQNDTLEIIKTGVKVATHSTPGYDYFIAQNLYSPCALLSKPVAQTAHKQQLEDWCNRLKTDGYIQGDSTPSLAANAIMKLSALGIGENKQLLSPLMDAIKIWPALAITYTNQFGRFAFEDTICDSIFTALNPQGEPVALGSDRRERLFADSNGIPPTAGIAIYNIDKEKSAYDLAVCFDKLSNTARVREGINEVIASGNLHQTPTIIVHGENDNLVEPNHTSRAYYGTLLHRKMHTPEKIRYFEVRNAQHFDAFLTLPQFASTYVPLHYYFEQSLDLMLAHLTQNKSLPPSQVVNTNTRNIYEDGVEPLEIDHLPALSLKPTDPILLKDNQLIIP
jgi:hydroxybutyrate-dimer hydrolase